MQCGLENQRENQRVRFPVRAHALVLGQVPSRGCKRKLHIDVSLSPSLL